MMDDLPKSVRVGPHDVRFERLNGEDAKRNYGTFLPAELAINLQDKYASGSQAADTILHEIIHAIFAVWSVDVKRGEEHIVSVLGTSLTQIIRDNPGLIAWLQETVKK